MYYVYILTNDNYMPFYTGVTNNVERRTLQHNLKEKRNGFPERYDLNRLVYIEAFTQVTDAIAAEKRIKKLSHINKRKLIAVNNPKFDDLFTV